VPSFEFHYWLGKKVGIVIAVVSGVAAIFLTFDLAWTILAMLVGYYSTVVGSVAPDIDLSQPNNTLKYASKPYRQLILLINFLIVIVLALSLAMYNQGDVGIKNAVVSAGGVGLTIVAIRLIPDFLHSIMPKHRGITHGFLFWTLMSAVFGYTIYQLLAFLGYTSVALTLLPATIGVAVLMGAFTHISSDSISTIIKHYVPESARNYFPWVPRKLPILLDLPKLLKVLFDRRAPNSVRLLVVFTAIYGIYPVDAIPDVVPIIGWIDDFSVYLYLRQTIYSSYKQKMGVIENITHDIQLFNRVIIPALLLGTIALVILVLYLG
jgi:uncharacterized membrane protein YkvA (DUF1232 family)